MFLALDCCVIIILLLEIKLYFIENKTLYYEFK